MIPTAKSYFSGGGLMDLGLMRAGIKLIQSLDLDKRAIDCMRNNSKYFSHSIVHADMRDVLVKEQPRSNIMVFTWPCKKYSTIADIHGTRTGEELYLHGLRHIVIEEPDMYILENVPGMKKFKVVMEALTQLPGYYINVFCPVDAANWLPQRRERLIIFGTKKPFNISAPRKAKRIPTIKDILEKNATVHVNESVIARIKGQYRDLPIIVDPSNPTALAPTCVAHYSKDMGTRLVKDKNYKYGVRPFTIREYARLQGVPDDYILPDMNFSYEIIGNGVAEPKAHWAGKQAMKYFN